MKNTTLLFGLLFFCGIVYGQEEINTKNTARFGVSRAFFGAGDLIGPAIYAEYSYSLNDYFAITPRIMSAHAHRAPRLEFSHASSFGMSLSIRITPLPNSFRRLKIDFGGLYHKFIKTYGSIGQTPEHSKQHLFGLIGSLSVNIFDTKRIESGIRFDSLTSFTEGYFNSDSWQPGIYLGLKF